MWIMTENGWRPLSPVCVNANNVEGVFIDTPLHVRQAENLAAAERYCRAISEFHPVNNAGEFRGDHFIDHGYPRYDAFGRRV